MQPNFKKQSDTFLYGIKHNNNMQRPRFSRLQTFTCAITLSFAFSQKPALAESPQKSVTASAGQLTAAIGIDAFLANAPQPPNHLTQAVFEYIQNDGNGGFQTIPTDQSKGALTAKEYETGKRGDCTDTDLYVTAILTRAKERGLLPKDAIIGTITYVPSAHPDIGHVVTFISHPSITPSTNPLAQAASQKLGGNPITIIDPATATLGELKYPGTLSYLVTGNERNGLFFKEQADAALRNENEALAWKLYEKAFGFLKNNADASKEIREKLGTYEFNEGIGGLKTQDFEKALGAMKKANEYNQKPLYAAFVLHAEGLVAVSKNDAYGAKQKFEASNKALREVTGADEGQARQLKANNDNFINALSQ